MTASWSAHDLAGLPGMPASARAVRRLARRESWTFHEEETRGGIRRLYPAKALPLETRAHLEGKALPSQTELDGLALGSALAKRYALAPEKHRAIALRRMRAVELYVRLRTNGATVRHAADCVRCELGAHKSATEKWARLVDGHPRADWPCLLLPTWRNSSKPEPVNPEAWNWFLSDVLRQSKPALAACYRRLLAEAKRHADWQPIPSLRSLAARYRREVPATVRLVRREGARALEHKLPAQRRDKSGLQALEEIVGDGHRFDVFTLWPTVTGKPRISRPFLMAWQDVYSGKVLAWRIDETENADATRLALADLIRDYGVPEHATIDNGHAWASKSMTGGAPNRKRFGAAAPDEFDGIYKAFEIEPHFAEVAHGQSKPIERTFLDLCEDIARSPECEGAYSGNSPSHKPANYGSRAIPIEEFRKLVAEKVAEHNAREGRRSPICQGRSFNEVFEESYRGRVVRRATDAQIHWLMLTSEHHRVSQDEAVITLMGNRYHHSALLELQGQQLTIRYDRDNLHSGVWVFKPGTLQALCHAECIAPVGWRDTEAARRDKRARAIETKAIKAKAAALGTLSPRELTSDRPRARHPKVVEVDFAKKPPAGGRVIAGKQRSADEVARIDALAQEMLVSLGRGA